MTVQVRDSAGLRARVLRGLHIGDNLTVTPVDDSGGLLRIDATGGGGPGSEYVWVQGIPLAVWTIPHHLGRRIAAVRVVDSSGEACEGDYDELDANTLQLTFSAAFAGGAVLE